MNGANARLIHVKLRNASTIVLLVGAHFCLAATGNETVFESGPTKVHLLELFTSEGCSSCPPAEVWMAQLKRDNRLWRDFVPLAFHVDYWDRLGWRDRFAAKEWTARQEAYATRWKAGSVYTPAVVVDGSEATTHLPRPSPGNVGTLRLRTNGDDAQVDFKLRMSEPSGYKVYLAGLGFALASDITAGENSGRRLSHDFVVLWIQEMPLSSDGTKVKFKIDWSRPDKIGALAAWITLANNPTPIQATGGWLPK